jgi:predicted transcriptional regulator
MSKFEKSMEEIFDINPLSDIKNEEDVPKSISLPEIKQTYEPSSDLEYDLKDAYEQTKDNLQDIIDQGKEAMEEILHIAKEGQHPRAFEVYSGLLKNVIDANKELLNVQKQMRDMDGKGKETNNTRIDKAVFVGTPAELNKLLKGKSE